jgi:transcriptional regulator
MAKKSTAMLRGTLDLLVLEGLSHGGEVHGFALQEWLREVSDGSFDIDEGALYPALYRMADRGWLAAEWGISDRGRRAKYYRLTAAGEKALAAERVRWLDYVRTMGRFVQEDG